MTTQTALFDDFRALVATVPGKVALEVFARKLNMTEAAMRSELEINPPMARYYLQTVARIMREDLPEPEMPKTYGDIARAVHTG
jgi:hypothetical protein